MHSQMVAQIQYTLITAAPPKFRCLSHWGFDVATRIWTELRSAPGSGAGAGGSSIAVSGANERIDGKTEQGGKVDIYKPAMKAWNTRSHLTDGVSGSEPPSVSCLLAVAFHGRLSLVTAVGEHDSSPLVHQGADRMLDDVWFFVIQTSNGVRPRPLVSVLRPGASLAQTTYDCEMGRMTALSLLEAWARITKDSLMSGFWIRRVTRLEFVQYGVCQG